MLLIAILCVIAALGFFFAVRWSSFEVTPPWHAGPDSAPATNQERLRRYLWYVNVTILAGLVSGVVMFGVGGRLAMRLLAATSSDAVQGRITEADEIVGRITLGGTLGLILFVGILGGLAVGAIYMLVRRWLPRGRWNGLIFGALLLVLGASRIDPLRAENSDFDIVGPGWLAVVAFVAVVLGQGMLVAAIAGRYSKSLPLMTKERKTLVRYAPLLLLAPAFPLLLAVTAGAAVVLIAGQRDAVRKALSSPRTALVGRVLGLVLAAVAAPGFVLAVADIVGS